MTSSSGTDTAASKANSLLCGLGFSCRDGGWYSPTGMENVPCPFFKSYAHSPSYMTPLSLEIHRPEPG